MLASMNAASTPRYSGVAIGLHWLLAVLIFGAFAVGLYAEDLPFSPAKVKWMNWHKWAGVTILLLSVARLIWRMLRPPPPLPVSVVAAMPRWQQAAHHGVHHLLYLLFFMVPLLGWAYSSARGFPIVWLGVLPLPDFVPVDKALAESIKPFHALSAYVLMGLVVLHIAAALKHQWVDRDGLLSRMLPGRS